MKSLPYLFIIFYVHDANTNESTTSDGYEEIAPYEHEFSPETFAFFNISKKHKKFDLSELEPSRRSSLYWYKHYAYKHFYTEAMNERTCYLMALTYLQALPELRRYFHIRFLYVNTLEYEVGYVTYDIVYRYQMMVEIFHMVQRKYYEQPHRFRTPVTLLFYLYRNLLEYSMTVIHLCNMMHELEAKYKNAPLGHWDDYPDEDDEQRKRSNYTRDHKQGSANDYLKRREQEYKRRQRERRRNRKKDMNAQMFQITTPQRRPKKSFWPKHYGWSIEYW